MNLLIIWNEKFVWFFVFGGGGGGWVGVGDKSICGILMVGSTWEQQ